MSEILDEKSIESQTMLESGSYIFMERIAKVFDNIDVSPGGTLQPNRITVFIRSILLKLLAKYKDPLYKYPSRSVSSATLYRYDWIREEWRQQRELLKEQLRKSNQEEILGGKISTLSEGPEAVLLSQQPLGILDEVLLSTALEERMPDKIDFAKTFLDYFFDKYPGETLSFVALENQQNFYCFVRCHCSEPSGKRQYTLTKINNKGGEVLYENVLSISFASQNTRKGSLKYLGIITFLDQTQSVNIGKIK